MIISLNPDPERAEFDSLLNATLAELNNHAIKNPQGVAARAGRALEPFIGCVMSDLAIGTVFEGSIEVKGGQKFPDIVAKRYYGIEVKTSQSNHWKTTGNSVFEGTRVGSVERIFMMFAKLARPVEFRCRPYEDVLSEIVVTHSPRYLIDMNLGPGNTIFDKINMAYGTLRKDKNPIKPIIEYYKTKLLPGEELWWMDQSAKTSTNLVIRIWSNLTEPEKFNYISRSMAYFPEIFSNSSSKFNRVALWLFKHEGVVCPNVRDLYTAGGKGSYTLGGVQYKDVSRVLLNLFAHFPDILDEIAATSAAELSHHWGGQTEEPTKVSDWATLVIGIVKMNRDFKHVEIDVILEKLSEIYLLSK